MKKLLKVLSGIVTWIKNLFAELPADLKKAVELGVIVTENLKLLIDSPVADVATALIPGNADDKVKDWLRANLPGILVKLKLIAAFNVHEPFEQIILRASKAIQDLDTDAKSAFLHNLAILIAKARADGKLTWSDGVYLLEWVYQERKKQAA
ncbi:hypothetical protein EOD41_10730 [Mucilaginibacter limnophilus]|uniref:Uncharacterized protein n=1 Tax=Mucilaginibacter limnophilus TaxID=1932778 RepID=A0A3S2Y3G8_9SPHI|nr:hypothetical protein [Mucilaginibacter limnophilus]RVU01081.1 hypothetical protein EOD41_10730 [Mucilaginibacter limnophilus]